jgi:ADP-heptose:LPS heptosyltransferase
LKRFLTATVARAVRRERLTPEQLLGLRPRALLIVRQQNQMGDMVCATPVFRALREAYPEARIGLITAPVNREVVQHNPHLDRIFTFEQKLWRRPNELRRFLAQLRGFGAELAFVLASVSFSVTSAGLALASGARWVVGADSLPFGLDLSRHAFSLEMPSNPVIDINAVDHGLAPLQALGFPVSDRSTVVVPSAAERTAAAGILRDLDLAPGFWAVHPGAGKRQNLWPAPHFAEMIRRANDRGARVLILHGPADGDSLAALQAELGGRIGPDVRIAPPSPVGVGAALLNEAERFLCNDTGVMHVAGALGVPTVALFGPTDPGLWKPPTEAVVAVRSTQRTPDDRGEEYGWLENVDPEAVWKAWTGLQPRTEAPA